MKQIDELNLIMELLRKYNLPLSPILEYAIKEKIEALEGASTLGVNENKMLNKDDIPEMADIHQEDTNQNIKDDIVLKQPLAIVDYGARSIVVIGDTKPFKDIFKTNGGYFSPRFSCGPGWLFGFRKRNRIEELVNRINSTCQLANNIHQNKQQDNEVSGGRIKTSYIITPSVYTNYLRSVEKTNGGYYTNSSISVYTTAMVSKYMKSKVEKYNSSGNLYNIVDLDVLAKLADDILQDIKAHKVSNSYLIALKLYIQLLNEKKILTNI